MAFVGARAAGLWLLFHAGLSPFSWTAVRVFIRRGNGETRTRTGHAILMAEACDRNQETKASCTINVPTLLVG